MQSKKVNDVSHCNILRLTIVWQFEMSLSKLQGKVVPHSEEVLWWRIFMVECVTFLDISVTL